jgi:hypothetical protein
MKKKYKIIKCRGKYFRFNKNLKMVDGEMFHLTKDEKMASKLDYRPGGADVWVDYLNSVFEGFDAEVIEKVG